MGTNYPSIYVKKFDSQITLTAQQEVNRISNIITKSGTVKGDVVLFDYLAPTKWSKVLDKFADTKYIDLTYSRRGIGFNAYDWATITPGFDIQRITEDPRSAVTLNAAYAKLREMDAVAYAAMWGDSYITTGNDVILTPEVFPAANIIESDAITGGVHTNASYALLNHGAAHIQEQEVDTELPQNELFVLLNTSAIEALKLDDKVINNDYNSNNIVRTGQLPPLIAGCRPIRYEGLNIDGSSDAFGIIFARQGMGFMERANIGIRIDELPGKRYNTGIYASSEFASVRLQDTHVVIVKFRQ